MEATGTAQRDTIEIELDLNKSVPSLSSTVRFFLSAVRDKNRMSYLFALFLL